MPVIGTAGHVDHGKTALIAALTGMNTDRLPEEKARGMTTDLGFAHFEGGGMTIGVIDVPGHERYIRNMVAGAWGIDGAMLVVAADDGWMEQTGRHAEVLAALDVPVLVVVITKSDMVPEARLSIVAEEARARLAALSPAASPPWVAVDSLRGRGIAELGGILIAALGALAAKPAGEARPFLFADRAFTLPGPGLVVTGSLRGGPLSAGDELLRLPAGERLHVRSLQRYGVPAQVAEPGSRVALSFLKSRTTLARGDCLASPESSFRATKSCYLALDRRYASWKPRTGLSLESATGTAHVDAQLWLARTPGFVRLVFDDPVATAPGQAVILLRKGGADILASGRVLAIGGEAPDDRRRIEAALPSAWEAAMREGASVAQVTGAFGLAYAGCLPLSSGLVLPAGAERAGDWVFSAQAFVKGRSIVEAAAREPGGFPETGIAGRLGLGKEAASALVRRLREEGFIIVEGGSIALPGGLVVELLPKPVQALAERLERAGVEGIDIGAPPEPGAKRDFALLCRVGRAISLDGRLFLATAAFQELAAAITQGRAIGSRFSVGDAKAATGLSRKWILPLLNRMEGAGMVKREGDERIVLKGKNTP